MLYNVSNLKQRYLIGWRTLWKTGTTSSWGVRRFDECVHKQDNIRRRKSHKFFKIWRRL